MASLHSLAHRHCVYSTDTAQDRALTHAAAARGCCSSREGQILQPCGWEEGRGHPSTAPGRAQGGLATLTPHWVPGEGVTGRGPWRVMHVVPCAGRSRSTCMMRADGEGLDQRLVAAGTHLGLAPSSLPAAGLLSGHSPAPSQPSCPPSCPGLWGGESRRKGRCPESGWDGAGDAQGGGTRGQRNKDRGCR